MTVDTQSTDKSVAQQLTATTYDLLSYFFVKKNTSWSARRMFYGRVDHGSVDKWISERCMYVTPIRSDLL